MTEYTNRIYWSIPQIKANLPKGRGAKLRACGGGRVPRYGSRAAGDPFVRQHTCLNRLAPVRAGFCIIPGGAVQGSV